MGGKKLACYSRGPVAASPRGRSRPINLNAPDIGCLDVCASSVEFGGGFLFFWGVAWRWLGPSLRQLQVPRDESAPDLGPSPTGDSSGRAAEQVPAYSSSCGKGRCLALAGSWRLGAPNPGLPPGSGLPPGTSVEVRSLATSLPLNL